MFRPQSLHLVALLVAVSAPAFAQQRTAPAASSGPDIVVTGVSLKEAQAKLDECLARHCPPNKDIDATLAVAETQFVAGDYHAARATMLKSIGRNHRFAKTYPVPVSDLFRANSRVAAHLGDEEAYFSSALDVVTTLKAGLPATDPRVLGGELELGDGFAKTGRVDSAFNTYQRVAKRAHALNLPRVEGYALLRAAIVYEALSKARGDEYDQAAVDATDKLIARTDPGLAPYVIAAKLLKGNIAVKHGDPGAVDRLVAEYRSASAGAARPVLLYSPKLEMRPLSGREMSSGETLGKTPMGDFDDQWIDVSFQIAPDGTVSDAAVLRKSEKLSGDWVQPILTAITGRRYAPLAADGAGSFRVERYSFTSAWTTITGTHMHVRSPTPRVEMVDLSQDAGVPAS